MQSEARSGPPAEAQVAEQPRPGVSEWKSGEAPAFPRNRADRGQEGVREVAGRTRKEVWLGVEDVMRVRPGKPHYRRPGPGPQRPGGPGRLSASLRAAPGFHSDRGAGRRGGCRYPASPSAARVALSGRRSRAWTGPGAGGARSARERAGAPGAPRTAARGPRVSAALSSPGRVSAPHGRALPGLLLPQKSHL